MLIFGHVDSQSDYVSEKSCQVFRDVIVNDFVLLKTPQLAGKIENVIYEPDD